MNSGILSKLPSLSQQIKKQLLWLGTALVLASLVLLVLFSWRSIDLLSNQLSNLQADSLIRNVKNDPNLSFPVNRQNAVFRHWQDIPMPLRERQKYSDLVPGLTVEHVIPSSNGQFNYVYLLMREDSDLGELFFISQYSEVEIEQLADRFITAAFRDALWIVTIIFGVLFLLIRWLLYKTSQPLAQLSRWAEDMTDQTVAIDIENFSNQEASYIAQQLQTNIHKLESYNRREQTFLKHASHEFRTPIAIIQASLDTLNITFSHNASVERALRATGNMNQLATSLLWLARESNQAIKKETLCLTKVIQDILTNLDYLLQKKQIVVKLDVKDIKLFIERELLIIVLTNLVRNGFEHCDKGEVNILLDENHFEISNSYKASNSETGFGLGLALTEKICDKFSWEFHFSKETLIASATVHWRS